MSNKKSLLAILLVAKLVLLISQFAIAQAKEQSEPNQPASSQPEPTKHALLIGVTEYKASQMNDPPLKYPEADATAIGQRLRMHGYQVTLLLGKDATKDAILAKLTELGQAGSSEGAVVVGLFGHGVEFDGSQEAMFCPYNTDLRILTDKDGKQILDENGGLQVEPDPKKLVKMLDVLAALKLCKAANKLLLADCCRNDSNAARGRAFGPSITVNNLPDGTACLFACKSGEKAFEHEDWQHGAMTKAFLDHFSRLEDPDSDILEITGRMSRSIESMVRSVTQGRKKQTLHPIIKGIVDLKLTTESKLISYLRKQGYLDGIKIYPGQPAPELPPLKFYEGEPFDKFEPGKVYALNTFESTCPPCIYSIPRLSDLQSKYGQVIFVDIDIYGVNDAMGFLKSTPNAMGLNFPRMSEEGKKLRINFLEWWKGKFGYRFAADETAVDLGGEFEKNWIHSLHDGSSGYSIPTTFVVDQSGLIAWIGHPKEIEGSGVLEKCIAGTLDLNAAGNMFLLDAGLNQAITKYSSQLSKKENSMELKQRELAEADRELDVFLSLCSSREESERVFISKAHLLLALLKINNALGDGAAKEQIKEYSIILNDFDGQIWPCNIIAWGLWERFKNKEPTPPIELLKLVGSKLEKSLEKASSEAELLSARDTLAHIEFALGNTAKAIELQTETIRLAPEGEDRIAYEEFLKELLKAKTK